jgi:hypothetical protein
MAPDQWAATERVAARIALAEGVTLAGEIYLQPSTAFHETRETPLEMLNRRELFFPLSQPGGQFLLIAKAQVVSLSYEGAVVDDPERASAARHIGIEVTMVGGASYEGDAATELPPNKSRLSDYLNAPEPFFSMVVGESTLCLNRSRVRSARPLS